MADLLSMPADLALEVNEAYKEMVKK